MQATVEYLLNKEPGLGYCEGRRQGARGGTETGDLELIGNALFEGSVGRYSGNEGRVITVRLETERVISRITGEVPAILCIPKRIVTSFLRAGFGGDELERADQQSHGPPGPAACHSPTPATEAVSRTL